MKKKSSTPLAEVTFTVRGASIASVMKKIADPSKPALERAQIQLNGLGQQIAAMDRELGAARMSEGDVRAQLLEAQEVIRSLEKRIRAGLYELDKAPDPRPTYVPAVTLALRGTSSPPEWSHLCSKLNDQKVLLFDLEPCPNCSLRKAGA